MTDLNQATRIDPTITAVMPGPVATDQVFDVDQAGSAETARLVSINEIPWAPTLGN